MKAGRRDPGLLLGCCPPTHHPTRLAGFDTMNCLVLSASDSMIEDQEMISL